MCSADEFRCFTKIPVPLLQQYERQAYMANKSICYLLLFMYTKVRRNCFWSRASSRLQRYFNNAQSSGDRPLVHCADGTVFEVCQAKEAMDIWLTLNTIAIWCQNTCKQSILHQFLHCLLYSHISLNILSCGTL